MNHLEKNSTSFGSILRKFKTMYKIGLSWSIFIMVVYLLSNDMSIEGFLSSNIVIWSFILVWAVAFSITIYKPSNLSIPSQYLIQYTYLDREDRVNTSLILFNSPRTPTDTEIRVFLKNLHEIREKQGEGKPMKHLLDSSLVYQYSITEDQLNSLIVK